MSFLLKTKPINPWQRLRVLIELLVNIFEWKDSQGYALDLRHCSLNTWLLPSLWTLHQKVDSMRLVETDQLPIYIQILDGEFNSGLSTEMHAVVASRRVWVGDFEISCTSITKAWRTTWLHCLPDVPKKKKD